MGAPNGSEWAPGSPYGALLAPMGGGLVGLTSEHAQTVTLFNHSMHTTGQVEGLNQHSGNILGPLAGNSEFLFLGLRGNGLEELWGHFGVILG